MKTGKMERFHKLKDEMSVTHPACSLLPLALKTMFNNQSHVTEDERRMLLDEKQLKQVSDSRKV